MAVKEIDGSHPSVGPGVNACEDRKVWKLYLVPRRSSWAEFLTQFPVFPVKVSRRKGCFREFFFKCGTGRSGTRRRLGKRFTTAQTVSIRQFLSPGSSVSPFLFLFRSEKKPHEKPKLTSQHVRFPGELQKTQQRDTREVRSAGRGNPWRVLEYSGSRVTRRRIHQTIARLFLREVSRGKGGSKTSK